MREFGDFASFARFGSACVRLVDAGVAVKLCVADAFSCNTRKAVGVAAQRATRIYLRLLTKVQMSALKEVDCGRKPVHPPGNYRASTQYNGVGLHLIFHKHNGLM